ncbi:MAG: tRNA-dihydrouridine synthase [Deltaproteobacteria bacterium]|nr:tRNA-dihydrouridine synthase [Deltaproteobacteria bacterium]
MTKSAKQPCGCARSRNTRGLFAVAWPFTIPSGVVTTAAPVLARIAREVKEIGFLTTKTLSLDPRPGYREPIIHEYHPGCFINAVGLANPGASQFADAMKPLLPLHDGKPLLVSIMGSDPEEFLECAAILDDVADAFELNLSCPHVKGAGQSVGSDPRMVEKIVRLLRTSFKKPIIPKLSPNIANIVEMAKICEKAGASGLALINTVGPGTSVDDDGNPVLSNVVGGLSGVAIKPIGLKLVREVSAEVSLPIIASGGIASPNDVEAYRKAGATYFAVGSSLAGMSTTEIKKFFKWIAGTNASRKSISKKQARRRTGSLTNYARTKVVSNNLISSNMFRLELEEGPRCEPGQFFFLRIPDYGEKPFSPFQDARPVYLIRSVGPFTEKLSTLEKGDSIYLRGPYGNGFKPPGELEKIIVLGGGTGAAPILMAAARWRANVIRTFIGFSQPVQDWFMDEIQSMISLAQITIDAPGQVGAVIELIDRELSAVFTSLENTKAYICGPATMMNRAGALFARFLESKDIYIAREDIMKCGIGLCGSCGTEKGLRSCIDGPVFRLND